MGAVCQLFRRHMSRERFVVSNVQPKKKQRSGDPPSSAPSAHLISYGEVETILKIWHYVTLCPTIGRHYVQVTGPPLLIRQIRYSTIICWNEFNPIILLLVNPPIRKPPSIKDN